MEIISRKQAIERSLKQYFTGKQCRHGHTSQRMTSNRCCIECKKINETEWDRDHYEQRHAKRRDCYYRDHEHSLIMEKNKRNRNIEACRERTRRYLKSHPEVRNAHRAKHDAAKQSATPLWLSEEDLAQIIQLYKEAVQLKKATGHKHHVDHIHPLTSPYVCGLHVPWNMQVLTAFDNIRKHNNFCPHFLSREELAEVQRRFSRLSINIPHDKDDSDRVYQPDTGGPHG